MKFADDPNGLEWFQDWITSALFDWDQGNINKNRKHGIEYFEIEEIFFNPILFVGIITEPKSTEPRWLIIGEIKNKIMTLIATRRGERLRIISCRRARKNEVEIYGKIKAD